MLDGAARIDELVAAAVADGQPALGITDHGNLYGVLDFYEACRARGVSPIIGTEAYMALESRHERPVRRGRVDDTGGDAEGGKLYYHLTLLAENNPRLRQPAQALLGGVPRGLLLQAAVDWELLARHHEGLIATSGCLGGVVLQRCSQATTKVGSSARRDSRRSSAGTRFFIELQDHGLDEQRRTNPKLIEIASKLGAPLLATNDSHYTRRDDATSHDALLCVQTGALLDDEKRFRFHGQDTTSRPPRRCAISSETSSTRATTPCSSPSERTSRSSSVVPRCPSSRCPIASRVRPTRSARRSTA